MELIYTASFWLIVGSILLIMEIFSGMFFALAFGIAAVLMAIWLKVAPHSLTAWHEILFMYSVFGLLLSSFGCKRWFQDQSVDIND